MATRIRTTCRAGALASALVAMLAFSAPVGAQADDESRIQRGFAIAPVPLDVHKHNPALIGLGSYLVAVGGCNDCHTNPPYLAANFAAVNSINAAAYLGGGMSFGPFVSRTGLPAGLTLDEFVRVIRTGIDPDQLHPQLGPFLQVMPWPGYRNMTNRDLVAIYEYLSAIPCVEGGPGEPLNRC